MQAPASPRRYVNVTYRRTGAPWEGVYRAALSAISQLRGNVGVPGEIGCDNRLFFEAVWWIARMGAIGAAYSFVMESLVTSQRKAASTAVTTRLNVPIAARTSSLVTTIFVSRAAV